LIPDAWCSWVRWAPTPLLLSPTPTHRIGQRASFEIPKNRAKNTTLRTSLHAEGMGPSMAVEGATTREVFEAYVERFLAPALRPGQVVVMDNLVGAHRPKRVRELIEARGCKLIYLPPYSPDLNPIEEAFRGGQTHPQEDRRPRQGGPNRGEESSIGSRAYRGRMGLLRSLWLPHPGATTMKDAVRT
jgi:hypothetical protein